MAKFLTPFLLLLLSCSVEALSKKDYSVELELFFNKCVNFSRTTTKKNPHHICYTQIHHTYNEIPQAFKERNLELISSKYIQNICAYRKFLLSSPKTHLYTLHIFTNILQSFPSPKIPRRLHESFYSILNKQDPYSPSLLPSHKQCIESLSRDMRPILENTNTNDPSKQESSFPISLRSPSLQPPSFYRSSVASSRLSILPFSLTPTLSNNEIAYRQIIHHLGPLLDFEALFLPLSESPMAMTALDTFYQDPSDAQPLLVVVHSIFYHYLYTIMSIQNQALQSLYEEAGPGLKTIFSMKDLYIEPKVKVLRKGVTSFFSKMQRVLKSLGTIAWSSDTEVKLMRGFESHLKTVVAVFGDVAECVKRVGDEEKVLKAMVGLTTLDRLSSRFGDELKEYCGVNGEEVRREIKERGERRRLQETGDGDDSEEVSQSQPNPSQTEIARPDASETEITRPDASQTEIARPVVSQHVSSPLLRLRRSFVVERREREPAEEISREEELLELPWEAIPGESSSVSEPKHQEDTEYPPQPSLFQSESVIEFQAPSEHSDDVSTVPQREHVEDSLDDVSLSGYYGRGRRIEGEENTSHLSPFERHVNPRDVGSLYGERREETASETGDKERRGERPFSFGDTTSLLMKVRGVKLPKERSQYSDESRDNEGGYALGWKRVSELDVARLQKRRPWDGRTDSLPWNRKERIEPRREARTMFAKEDKLRHQDSEGEKGEIEKSRDQLLELLGGKGTVFPYGEEDIDSGNSYTYPSNFHVNFFRHHQGISERPEEEETSDYVHSHDELDTQQETLGDRISLPRDSLQIIMEERDIEAKDTEKNETERVEDTTEREAQVETEGETEREAQGETEGEAQVETEGEAQIETEVVEEETFGEMVTATENFREFVTETERQGEIATETETETVRHGEIATETETETANYYEGIVAREMMRDEGSQSSSLPDESFWKNTNPAFLTPLSPSAPNSITQKILIRGRSREIKGLLTETEKCDTEKKEGESNDRKKERRDASTPAMYKLRLHKINPMQPFNNLRRENYPYPQQIFVSPVTTTIEPKETQEEERKRGGDVVKPATSPLLSLSPTVEKASSPEIVIESNLLEAKIESSPVVQSNDSMSPQVPSLEKRDLSKQHMETQNQGDTNSGGSPGLRKSLTKESATETASVKETASANEREKEETREEAEGQNETAERREETAERREETGERKEETGERKEETSIDKGNRETKVEMDNGVTISSSVGTSVIEPSQAQIPLLKTELEEPQQEGRESIDKREEGEKVEEKVEEIVKREIEGEGDKVREEEERKVDEEEDTEGRGRRREKKSWFKTIIQRLSEVKDARKDPSLSDTSLSPRQGNKEDSVVIDPDVIYLMESDEEPREKDPFGTQETVIRKTLINKDYAPTYQFLLSIVIQYFTVQ